MLYKIKKGDFEFSSKLLFLLDLPTHFVPQIVNRNNFLDKNRVFLVCQLLRRAQSIIPELICCCFMSFQMLFLNNQLYWHFYNVLILMRRNNPIEKINNKLSNNGLITTRKIIDGLKKLG